MMWLFGALLLQRRTDVAAVIAQQAMFANFFSKVVLKKSVLLFVA